MTQSDFINEVIEAVKAINSTIDNDALLQFVAEEVVDRVSIYLNYAVNDEFDARLVRIVARIASGVFNQTNANVDNAGADQAISSVSDNGQSVSFSDKVKNYLASSDDNELFSGFSQLLARYRRVNVVSRSR